MALVGCQCLVWFTCAHRPCTCSTVRSPTVPYNVVQYTSSIRCDTSAASTLHKHQVSNDLMYGHRRLCLCILYCSVTLRSAYVTRRVLVVQYLVGRLPLVYHTGCGYQSWMQ